MVRAVGIVVLALATACPIAERSYRNEPDAPTDGASADVGGPGCETLVSPAPDGHHNPGTTCIVAGCHDGATAGAPRYTVAGTLYTSAAGTAPRTGATVLIPTGNGDPIKMVTATNGNFWREAPTTLPARMSASLCPTTIEMTSQSADGNCNGCHGPGSRIALPMTAPVLHRASLEHPR